MRQLILITLMMLSFNASSEVSNYEYNYLVDEYNDLKDDYNDLVDEYNDLKDKYNNIVGKHNKLVDKNSTLIDEYNELVFNNIMSRITKIQLDEEIIDVAVVGLRGLYGYGNRCLLGSTIYSSNGKEYSISFDFEKGIGWSKPSSYRDSIKIEGTTPGVSVIARPEDEIKELQRLFIEEDNLREELAQLFRKLHGECYTS